MEPQKKMNQLQMFPLSVTSADMGCSVHFDLTKLKFLFFSGEVNVDVPSFHVVAFKGHCWGQLIYGDDCTPEGEGGADRQTLEEKKEKSNCLT